MHRGHSGTPCMKDSSSLCARRRPEYDTSSATAGALARARRSIDAAAIATSCQRVNNMKARLHLHNRKYITYFNSAGRRRTESLSHETRIKNYVGLDIWFLQYARG